MTNASIIGSAIGEPTTKYDGPAMPLIADTFWKTLKDANLNPNDIDGLVITPPGFAGPPRQMFASHAADYLQLETSNLALLENGGTTGALAMRYAADQISLNRSEKVAVIALDIRPTGLPGGGGKDMKSAMHQAIQTQTSLYGPYDAPYGIGAPIPYYGMSSQRYMAKHDLTRRDVAEVPVALREMASKHPKALHREPISVEDVLESKPLSPPIHILDSSQFCTGTAGLVLTRKDLARKICDNPVNIITVSEHNHPSHFVPLQDPITSFKATRIAGEKAFANAGISPEDVDVAEVYGVFSATELIIYEDLGFFEEGKAANAVAEGKTRRDGKIAMNPTGGRLSFGHPATATPVIETAEVAKHLQGNAGERQIPDAEIGLVHAEHGMMNGSIVFILEGS